VIGCRVGFSRLPDRVPPFRLGSLGLASCALGLAVASLVTSVPGLVVGAAILAAGVAFITPAFFAAIIARVNPSQRGSALGTASVFLDLAFGAGPVLLGLVASVAGIPAAFGFAALVAGIGAAGTAAYVLVRRPSGLLPDGRA